MDGSHVEFLSLVKFINITPELTPVKSQIVHIKETERKYTYHVMSHFYRLG